MVLVARGAAVEVSPHARDVDVGVRAGKLQLDVPIQLLEALLAGQLRSRRPDEPCEDA